MEKIKLWNFYLEFSLKEVWSLDWEFSLEYGLIRPNHDLSYLKHHTEVSERMNHYSKFGKKRSDKREPQNRKNMNVALLLDMNRDI